MRIVGKVCDFVSATSAACARNIETVVSDVTCSGLHCILNGWIDKAYAYVEIFILLPLRTDTLRDLVINTGLGGSPKGSKWPLIQCGKVARQLNWRCLMD